jgi:hypothetical protein
VESKNMTYHSILTVMLGASLLLGQASAQNRRPGYRDDSPASGNVIGRVMSDLNMAARNSRVDNHERKHFQSAMDDLRRFEDRQRQGKWDQGRLDKAIEHLSHLADARQLNPRDRRMMADDANMLRDFRASRYRYDRGSYRDGYRR